MIKSLTKCRKRWVSLSKMYNNGSIKLHKNIYNIRKKYDNKRNKRNKIYIYIYTLTNIHLQKLQMYLLCIDVNFLCKKK